MPPYVPNAIDVSQPTEEKFVFSAAEEFRKIKTRINEVAASIGTGSPINGGVTFPGFTINQATVNNRVEFPNTNPLGWAAGAGSMTVQFSLVFNSYFSANPGGHMAVVLRQDPLTTGTAVRGNGIAVGNLVTAPNGTQVNPGAQLESWANGLGSIYGDNNLIVGAEVPPGRALVDGRNYLFVIDSVVLPGGGRRFRMAIYQPDSGGVEWDIVTDTGYVVDSNMAFDSSKSMLMFGHVFPSNLTAWSIVVSNVTVVWGPAPNELPASYDKFSKYGGTIQGDVEMAASKLLKIPYNAGPSLATSFAMQAAAANAPTSVVVKPSGSSVIANTLYSNSSNNTNYKAAVFGITGDTAVIQTLSTSGGDPTIKMSVGATEVVSLTPTGIKLLSATRNMGVAIPFGVGLTNFGGANALAHNASNILNIDVICTDGVMRTLMSPNPTNEQVEVMLRPLYCIVSGLIADLKAKKVI